MIREAGANEIIFVTLLSLFQQQIWIGDSSGQMPQIEQLRLTPRATPGATPRATPKMMYYDACPTQTAARFQGAGGVQSQSAKDAARQRYRRQMSGADPNRDEFHAARTRSHNYATTTQTSEFTEEDHFPAREFGTKRKK